LLSVPNNKNNICCKRSCRQTVTQFICRHSGCG